MFVLSNLSCQTMFAMAAAEAETAYIMEKLRTRKTSGGRELLELLFRHTHPSLPVRICTVADLYDVLRCQEKVLIHKHKFYPDDWFYRYTGNVYTTPGRNNFATRVYL